MNKTIYLEINEEITEVIDKLKKAEEKQLIFVIPRNSTLAQSVINLKLLLRAAKESHKRICIVTSDSVTRNLSGQLGIESFDSIDEVKNADWSPAAEAIAADSRPNFRVHNYQNESERLVNDDVDLMTGTDESVEVEDKIKVRKIKISDGEALPLAAATDDHSKDTNYLHRQLPKELRGKDMNNSKYRKYVNMGLVGLVFLALIAWAIYIPSATVAVTMKTVEYKQKFQIVVDKNATVLDSAKAILPGVVVLLDKSLTKTYPATGTKNNGEKAKGTLTFSNTNGVDNQQINAGSTVTSGQVSFTVDKTIIVPKGTLGSNGLPIAGTIQGSVTAVAGGVAGHFSDGSVFVVAGKPSTISAKGSTAGGTDKEVKVVTAEDIEKANVAIKDAMLTEGKPEILDKATKEGVKVIDTSVAFELTSVQFNKKADDEADQFDAVGSGKLTVLGFAEQNLYDFAMSLATADLGSSKTIINPEAATTNYTVLSNDAAAGLLKLDVDFLGQSGQKIAAKTIVDKSIFKKKITAEVAISKMEGVESAKVAVSPSFMPFMPLRANRIDVRFDYKK